MTLLNVNDAADMAGVSHTTIRRALELGEIEAVSPTRPIRIDATEVERWTIDRAHHRIVHIKAEQARAWTVSALRRYRESLLEDIRDCCARYSDLHDDDQWDDLGTRDAEIDAALDDMAFKIAQRRSVSALLQDTGKLEGRLP